MLRRQLVTGLLMTIVLTVLVGLLYPLVVTGIAQVTMSKRANGSIVKVNGKVVGSSLIGQNFTDKDGNALPQYFQPRPSAAGDGYDALASGGLEPRPVEPEPHRQRARREHHDQDQPVRDAEPIPTACRCRRPTRTATTITDKAGNPVYEKNKDGTYVCDPNTVPERAMAYRELNGLAPDAKVPVDAVTASASGLDPQISVANARLQAARVAKGAQPHHAVVRNLIDAHTAGAPAGVPRGADCERARAQPRPRSPQKSVSGVAAATSASTSAPRPASARRSRC